MRASPAPFALSQSDKQRELWYNIAVDMTELPDVASGDGVEQSIFGHWIGLRGRLTRSYWGWMGIVAVLCGALASNHLEWDGEHLLGLGLVLVLVELGWGSLWDLAVGTDWFRPLAEDWPPSRFASLPALPYTQPRSPGGRIARGLGRLAAWWREAFWPLHGPALLGLLAAVILTAVLALLLPARLRPLHATLVALIGLGMVQRRRGRQPLAGMAVTQVGLGWLAGYAVLAEVEPVPVILALVYSLAAWGGLRIVAGASRGLWLLNGGQVLGAVVLVAVKQPLAAGIAGLFLFGQVAMQPALRHGDRGPQAVLGRRLWPWLMAAMLVAARVVP